MARRIPVLEDLAAIPGRLEAAVGDLLIPDWALWRLGETFESRAPRLAGTVAHPYQLEIGPEWARRVLAAEEAN